MYQVSSRRVKEGERKIVEQKKMKKRVGEIEKVRDKLKNTIREHRTNSLQV